MNLHFVGVSNDAQRFVYVGGLGSILDEDHFNSSPLLESVEKVRQFLKQEALVQQDNVSTDLTCSCLMVSPPFPMIRPALPAGMIISCMEPC